MFAKVNGNDVLWCIYTLRFNTSENLFQYCHAAEKLFREDKENGLHREVTPLRTFDVPEVLEVQVIPSEEVSMDP